MDQFQPAHFARLKHLAVFATVVDCGSFTKAGKRLGIAKSAVSRYVSELEDSVGVSLLVRTTRKLVLTDAGQRFYVDCARMIEAATDSFDSVGPNHHLLGSLHIGATAAFGRHVLVDAVKSFQELHPRLSVQMSLHARFVDLVEQGIDVSIRIGSAGHAPSYVTRKIGSMRFQLYASNAFAAEHDLSTPRKLERVPWVLSPLGPTPDQWTFRRGRRTWTITAQSQLLTDSAEVSVRAAEIGMGVTGLPDFMQRLPKSLVRVLPQYVIEPELPIVAVYPQRRFVSPRVRGFLAHLRALGGG